MTWFGLSIEAEYRASGTSSKVPLPSIEPITFQCRADTLRVMPRTRVRSLINNIYIKSGRARGVDGVLTWWYWVFPTYLIMNFIKKISLYVYYCRITRLKIIKCWHIMSVFKFACVTMETRKYGNTYIFMFIQWSLKSAK